MLLRNYNLIRLLNSAKLLTTVYAGDNAAKDYSIFEEHAAKRIRLTSLTKSIHFTSFVNKYKKTSTRDDIDTDSDEETEMDFKDERDSKIVKAKVNSLRADLVLKAGLNVARKQVFH